MHGRPKPDYSKQAADCALSECLHTSPAAQRAERARADLREEGRQTIKSMEQLLENYEPVRLTDLIDSCPEVQIEEAEERLEQGDPQTPEAAKPPEAKLAAEDIPKSLQWISGEQSTSAHLYGFSTQVARKVVREELLKFAERFDKYYVLQVRRRGKAGE